MVDENGIEWNEMKMVLKEKFDSHLRLENSISSHQSLKGMWFGTVLVREILSTTFPLKRKRAIFI